jgi:hypothetical protein
MKAITILFFATFIYMKINAQNHFGINIGINNTTAMYKYSMNDYKPYIQSLNRFFIGGYWQKDIKKQWFVKTTLNYTQKGNFYSNETIFIDAGKQVSLKLNYLETLFDVGKTIKLNKNQSIQVGGGIYVGLGIGGVEKGFEESLSGRKDVNRKIDFTFDNGNGYKPTYRPIDAGLTFNVQYQYKKYGVFLRYSKGLLNRESIGLIKNNVFYVGFSYQIK